MLNNRLKNSLNSFDDNSGNPMDNVSNLSDAMLVLAVGIMLALVINWKVDLKIVNDNSQQKVAVDENKLQEINDANTKQNSSISFDDLESKYKKSGTVYTDVYTGKTYVVIEE